MGAKPSKPAFSTATVNLAEAQSVAASAASSAASGAWGTARTIMYVLLGLVVVGVIGATLYFIFAVKPLENSLTITKATFGSNDYAQLMQGNVQKDALYLSKGFSELHGATASATDTGTITYTFMDQPNSVLSATINKFDETIDISAANRDSKENFTNKRKPSSSTPNKTGPSFLGRLKNTFNYSGSSADLLPYPKDATSIATIPASSAPLSSGSEGAYGMQFWMYIKDWNHNFGKDKFIVSRNDSTNSNINNPEVSLHPTDNTLKISISIFPESNNASKTEPAPAGHSGATDDVFICEIPDIPLQAWTSVSLTVFSRNLDVYLNGKLVKSCFLSGVPKPASGDIVLNKNGGFSGYLCSFYHYPRMLVPSDAQTFFGQGTSCTAATNPSTASKVTGYGFKFGIYDAVGKEVNQYVL